jgi:hypothetical protein
MPITPVDLRPPELIVKAVSDGQRVGVQVIAVPGLKRPWFPPRDRGDSSMKAWVTRLFKSGTPQPRDKILKVFVVDLNVSDEHNCGFACIPLSLLVRCGIRPRVID